MIKRKEYNTLLSRLQEPRKFIQVIMGPRQVGKTTMVKQVLESINLPFYAVSADAVPATQQGWISECWDTIRAKQKASGASEAILVIDEIQKISNWSETVKKEWDTDTWNGTNIKVVLLGSSRILLLKGMSESLAGRYEEIRMGHWTFDEMQSAFGLSIEQYIYFGGYPGATSLIKNEERWRDYIRSAMVESTINKDILNDGTVAKPALLRQTFELGASYSSEIVSLTKMVGALADAGNTTTLSNYLQLLDKSGLLTGLPKIALDQARRRMSPPKFQVYNNALFSIFKNKSFKEAQKDNELWGRFFESSVGAFLANKAFQQNLEFSYWRDGDNEVDYVIRKNGKIAAFEVKSNETANTAGLHIFREKYKPSSALVIGTGGISIKEFFKLEPTEFL